MRGSVLTTKERNYIIGVFLGDGYAAYEPKSRHYRVEFSLNSIRDKDIINFLTILLRKAGYNPYEVQDQRYNVLYLRVNSKSLFNYLILEKKKLLFDKITLGRQRVLGLLSGLIDADGFVGHGEIELAQKDNSIAKLMQNLSDYLGLTLSVKHLPNTKGGKIWRIRVSTKFKTLAHSSQKVVREYG